MAWYFSYPEVSQICVYAYKFLPWWWLQGRLIFSLWKTLRLRWSGGLEKFLVFRNVGECAICRLLSSRLSRFCSIDLRSSLVIKYINSQMRFSHFFFSTSFWAPWRSFGCMIPMLLTKEEFIGWDWLIVFWKFSGLFSFCEIKFSFGLAYIWVII